MTEDTSRAVRVQRLIETLISLARRDKQTNSACVVCLSKALRSATASNDPGTIDDAAQPIGHDRQHAADSGQQKYRRNGKLNDVRNGLDG